MTPTPTSTVRTAAVLFATSALAFAQWTQIAPPMSPSGRQGAAMTYDGVAGSTVLFGGLAPSLNAETWIYPGGNWVQLGPTTSPSARHGAQLVHAFTKSILYGGWTSLISVGTPSNETWEFDGSTGEWTLVATSGGFGGRYWYGACFDLHRNRLVLHGGATSGLLGASNQTWEYDPSTTTWAQVTTVGNPGALARPAMCYDLLHQRTVLFGGNNYSAGGAISNALWTYDGTTWTSVPVAGAWPPARAAANLVYDSLRGVCILTSGSGASGVLDDTWEWNGVSWTQHPTAPTGARDCGIAYNPIDRQIVRFGGFSASGLIGQTWEFGARASQFGVGCPGTAGVPLLSAQGPHLGEGWTATVTNLNPAWNVAVYVFGFAEVPGLPLDFLGLTGCLLYTTPDIFVTEVGVAGTANWTWPSVFGGMGDVFFGQAMSFDPTVNSFGFVMSNAIRAVIGN